MDSPSKIGNDVVKFRFKSGVAEMTGANKDMSKDWIKRFSDRIVIFYGEETRKRADRAAAEYLAMHSANDDPDAAAILVMEGWSMAGN